MLSFNNQRGNAYHRQPMSSSPSFCCFRHYQDETPLLPFSQLLQRNLGVSGSNYQKSTPELRLKSSRPEFNLRQIAGGLLYYHPFQCVSFICRTVLILLLPNNMLFLQWRRFDSSLWNLKQNRYRQCRVIYSH